MKKLLRLLRFEIVIIDSFHATGLSLCPLKTLENLCFQGNIERPMARNELMQNKFSLAETLDLTYFDWSYHPVGKYQFEVNNKSLVATSICVVLVFLLQL